MSEFRSQTDIGDRVCQHVGVARIARPAGFTEDRKATQEIASAYGKLRRAELRRNTWRFAIKKAPLRPIDDDTLYLGPALWVAETTYFVGMIVSDDDGTFWISNSENNLGNRPGSTPTWTPYFGPRTVSLYDSTQSYLAGELVYTAAGDGTVRVYLSLRNGNEDNPATATAWAATSTYKKNDVVTYLAVAYMSLINVNIANTPSASPLTWSITTTYATGNQVCGSDGAIYTSLTNGNLAHDPVSDSGANWLSTGVLCPWTRTFVGGAGSMKWRQIGGVEFPSGVTLFTPNIVYPIGAGPSSQSGTRNYYRLPVGYLRIAPQDPKAGSVSDLGAPTNSAYDDWDFEGDFFTTSQSGVIVLRFVADMTDVTAMDDMFCETLAYHIALAVVEPLTQSSQKKKDIAQQFEKFGTEARLINGIEIGPVEAPMDEYLACRF